MCNRPKNDVEVHRVQSHKKDQISSEINENEGGMQGGELLLS